MEKERLDALPNNVRLNYFRVKNWIFSEMLREFTRVSQYVTNDFNAVSILLSVNYFHDRNSFILSINIFGIDLRRVKLVAESISQ